MTDNPITNQQLDELETLAKNIPAGPWTVDDTRAELRGSHGNLLADLWDDRLGAYFAAMHAVALPLVAEVRRLRAELDGEKTQHQFTLRQRNNRSERLNYLRDLANTGQTSLLAEEAANTLAASINDHLPADTDEMAASLRRDGFGDDEIAETLSRPSVGQ